MPTHPNAPQMAARRPAESGSLTARRPFGPGAIPATRPASRGRVTRVQVKEDSCCKPGAPKCGPCHALNPALSEERRRQLTLECLSKIPSAGDRRVELAAWREGAGGTTVPKAYQASVNLNPQGKPFNAASETYRAFRPPPKMAQPKRVVHEDAIKMDKGARFDAKSETSRAFTDATPAVGVMAQRKPAGDMRTKSHSWRPSERPPPRYAHAIPSLQLGGHEQVGRSEATTAFVQPTKVERQPPIKYKDALVVDSGAMFQCETETGGLFSAPDMTDYRLSMAPAGQPGARTQADGKVGLQTWRSRGAHTGAEMAAKSLAPGKGIKLDSSTTHQLAYQKVQAEARPAIVRHEPGIHVNPSLRLEGVSETREQFRSVPKVSAGLVGSTYIPSCAELLADMKRCK